MYDEIYALMGARQYIEDEDRWSQVSFGSKTSPIKRCLAGAIVTAMNRNIVDFGRDYDLDSVIEHMAESIKEQPSCHEKLSKFMEKYNVEGPVDLGYVIAYNDQSSHKEVLEVIDYAIEKAQTYVRKILLGDDDE